MAKSSIPLYASFVALGVILGIVAVTLGSISIGKLGAFSHILNSTTVLTTNLVVEEGITFNDTCGGSTDLSCYYETTFVVQFVTGIIQNSTAEFIKVGRVVTMFLPATSTTVGSTNSLISNTVAIPVAFRPATIFSSPVFVTNAAANVAQPGLMTVSTTGILSFWLTNTLTLFTGTTAQVKKNIYIILIINNIIY